MKKAFDVPHRHGVFTVSPNLREVFLKDRSLLNLLFDAVNATLSFLSVMLALKRFFDSLRSRYFTYFWQTIELDTTHPCLTG